MNLRQLEYFLAAVDHGGITRAATALHVAQPSLSQAIRSLERAFGVALFHRSGRGLVLTAAGQALVGPARQVQRDLVAVRASVGAVTTLAAGELAIASLPTLAVDPLVDLVGEYRTRHPGIRLRLVEPADADTVGELVLSGECELGLAHLPLHHPGLESLELGSQELVVVLPPGTPVGERGPVPLASLAGTPLIAGPNGTSTRLLLEQALATAGVAPFIVVESAHREAVVPLVLGGAGATFLPRSRALEAARRGAVARPTDPVIERRIGLVYPPELSPAARAFLELARIPTPAPGPPDRVATRRIE